MKKLLLAASVILIALISWSCKKDKSETTAQKVQHNWTFVNEIDNSHDASGDERDTTTGIIGDFVNFNSNGTVTSHFEGQDDNSAYSITNDTQIVIDGETYTIQTLSDSKFVLYAKEGSATEYDEVTINLKR